MKVFGRSLQENIFLVEKFSVLYFIGLKPFNYFLKVQQLKNLFQLQNFLY